MMIIMVVIPTTTETTVLVALVSDGNSNNHNNNITKILNFIALEFTSHVDISRVTKYTTESYCFISVP